MSTTTINKPTKDVANRTFSRSPSKSTSKTSKSDSKRLEEATNKDQIPSMREWSKNGSTWNLDWLAAHPEHWLSVTWKLLYNSGRLFAVTSCEVTAAMIRNKVTKCDQWILLENQDSKTAEKRSFQSIRRHHPIFQIAFGEEWMSDDHILTVIDDHAIQTYAKQYELQVTPITSKWADAIDCFDHSDTSLSLEQYQLLYSTITSTSACPKGIVPKKQDPIHVFYWIPPPKICKNK